MSTPQAPIGSGFGAASTTAEVIRGIDLTGKVAIVTGGYAGLGLETTQTFAAAGAKVIVPARDREKALKKLAGLAGVELETMDLMDPVSIDAFAERVLAAGRPLHLLVNNAGIMFAPLVRDARGFESHCSTNHLGHFQLTARPWPALRAAKGARVVQVSSYGHHYAPVVFDDPNFERRDYSPLLAYGQSKTANNLFAVALDARGKAEGVRAFSLHPGAIVATDLKRHTTAEDLRGAGVFDEEGKPIIDPRRGLKTTEQGAATTVWCATSPQLDGLGGVYCENCDIARLDTKADTGDRRVGDSTRTAGGVMPYSVDPEAADRLWSLSQRLLGLEQFDLA
jgi:NAD(P)-dependent dehydrogenase (short-subunit alcohol dehydrogenase family)